MNSKTNKWLGMGLAGLSLVFLTPPGKAQGSKVSGQVNPTKLTSMKMQSKTTGSGAPTLVLVPGGLTGWVSWDPYVEGFATTRRTVQVQLLNVEYGLKNAPLPEGYSVRMESLALGAGLAEQHVTGPVDMIAWSYGAEIALDYALENPAMIRTLTLIEPPAIWVLRADGGYDPATRETISFLHSLSGDITEELLEKFLVSVGFAQPGKSVRDLPQWNYWVPFRQSLRNSPAAIDHEYDVSRLKTFKAPVLLLRGTGSAEFLHHIIDGLARRLPNNKLLELPGGHAPHIVSKDQFLAELAKFQK